MVEVKKVASDYIVNMSSFYLAGVIPVSGRPLDFQMPWSDCVMPIAPNYTAIERAVVECAYAGCKTICIVANDDVSVMIKYRIGEWVRDPTTIVDTKSPELRERRIPIHYTPIHPKDIGKRDGLVWAILYGALTAYTISRKISTWVIPNRYYVCFPFAVYPPEVVRPLRRKIASKIPFFLSYKDKTVRDNEFLSFTFNESEYFVYRDIFKEKATGKYIDLDTTLPANEQYSGRFITFDEVFAQVELEKEIKEEIEWYYNISSWEQYCEYMSSKERKQIERPDIRIIRVENNLHGYRQWRGIGND